MCAQYKSMIKCSTVTSREKISYLEIGTFFWSCDTIK